MNLNRIRVAMTIVTLLASIAMHGGQAVIAFRMIHQMDVKSSAM